MPKEPPPPPAAKATAAAAERLVDLTLPLEVLVEPPEPPPMALVCPLLRRDFPMPPSEPSPVVDEASPPAVSPVEVE